ILAVLLVGGFFRSLQFTALNALSYADVARPEMGQATAIASVAQQLATSTGVALGALVLEMVQAWRGDATLVPVDFAIAFLVMGLLALASIASHAGLPRNAADEVAGRAPVKP